MPLRRCGQRLVPKRQGSSSLTRRWRSLRESGGSTCSQPSYQTPSLRGDGELLTSLARALAERVERYEARERLVGADAAEELVESESGSESSESSEGSCCT